MGFIVADEPDFVTVYLHVTGDPEFWLTDLTMLFTPPTLTKLPLLAHGHEYRYCWTAVNDAAANGVTKLIGEL